jgi:hypothetical protein
MWELLVNDLKPHSENHHCKCLPRIKTIGQSVLVCHNAFDGREFDEITEGIKGH